MSDIFGRRQQPSRIDRMQYRRRIPVAAHAGSEEDYVARVICAAREAAVGINREEYLQQVVDWATDDRALIHAWRYLSASGGHAPGIDGMTYADLPPALVYGALRNIRDEIREGRFQPDGLLITKIPKAGRATAS